MAVDASIVNRVLRSKIATAICLLVVGGTLGLAVQVFSAWIALILFLALTVTVMIFVRPKYGLYVYAAVFLTDILSYLASESAHLFLPLALVILSSTALQLMSRRTARVTIVDKKHFLALVPLLFVMAASLLIASDKSSSLMALYSWLRMFVLYLLVVLHIKTERDVEGLLWVCVLSMLGVSVYGLYTALFRPDLLFESGWRISSTVGNPIGLSFRLVIVGIFAHALSKKYCLWYQKVFLWFSMAFFIANISLSYTRTSYVLLPFIAMYYLFAGQRKNWIIRVVLAALLAALAILLLPSGVKSRFASLSDFAVDFSLGSRVVLNLGALKMFLDNPLLGIGIGNFRAYPPSTWVHSLDKLPLSSIVHSTMAFTYSFAAWKDIGNVPHNTYLEIASELGFLGLIFFITFLYLEIRSATHTKRRLDTLDSPLRPIGQVIELALWLATIWALFASAQFSPVFWIALGLNEKLLPIAHKQVQKGEGDL